MAEKMEQVDEFKPIETDQTLFDKANSAITVFTIPSFARLKAAKLFNSLDYLAVSSRFGCL